MTRRKQNAPKRLDCPSDDNSPSSQTSPPDLEETSSDQRNGEDLDDTDDNNDEFTEDIPGVIQNKNSKSKDESSDIDLFTPDNSVDNQNVKNKEKMTVETFNAKNNNSVQLLPNVKNGANSDTVFKSFEFSKAVCGVTDDQPLDLSTKPKHKSLVTSVYNNFSNKSESPISSSLKSLQMRFGGNFNIEIPRKLSTIVPLQPTKHPGRSGKPTCHSSLHSPLQAQIKPQFIKREKPSAPPNISISSLKSSPTLYEEDADPIGNKYTTHRCSCSKSYTTLQALSSHIQDSGHAPANSKASMLLDYPKLVRGQDMWLNQESEQTRRILRCMQCGESFQSLPMLTVHMMKTQHYTKIASSDHGRRSHKCSAYCEKELERECVFKCKVCHEAFSDMEALANHMVQSGHHKKQVLRPQNYPEFNLRNRRKVFHGDEESTSVSAYYDLKLRCLPIPNGLTDEEDSFMTVHHDNTITCENCGKKIEMKYFVDHVRACIRQKNLVAGALKRKLLSHELSKNESDSDTSCDSPSPIKVTDETSANRSPSPRSESKIHVSQHLKTRILKAFSPKKYNHTSDQQPQCTKTKCKEMDVKTKTEQENKTKFDHKQESGQSSEPKPKDRKIEENTKTRLSQTEKITVKLEPIDDADIKRETTLFKNAVNETDRMSPVTPNALPLDILDPNTKTNSSKSALEAMESFIHNSFTSKFDFRRQNCIPVQSNLHKASRHQTGRFCKDNGSSKYSKYKHLSNTLHNNKDPRNGQNYNAEDSPSESKKRKLCIKQESVTNGSDTGEKDTKYASSSPSHLRPDTPVSNPTSPVNSPLSSSAIVHKYLNFEEKSENKKTNNSALDSLSSFVYSQPMTSEHPLDSLQRLMTKTDIPKSLSKHFDLPYLTDITELALPLNLSIKHSLSDEEYQNESNELEIDVDNDGEMSSSNEERASPCSEGEQRDFKCAACSRHFVSKGSYRYHLSRCHLSSVRKYGIKEAFNMSPYIYLPLDHTAKFSKYYEMAYELANKDK